MILSIHHWKYLDGYNHATFEPVKDAAVDIVGWHCWVYSSDDHAFEQWMNEFCPTAQYTAKFSGGNRMYMLHITDPAEAAHFLLKWTT